MRVQRKGSVSGQAEKLLSPVPVAAARAQNVLNCSSRDVPSSLTAPLCDGREGKLCHHFADVKDFIHIINSTWALLPCIHPRIQPLGDSITLFSCRWEYQCTETTSWTFLHRIREGTKGSEECGPRSPPTGGEGSWPHHLCNKHQVYCRWGALSNRQPHGMRYSTCNFHKDFCVGSWWWWWGGRRRLCAQAGIRAGSTKPVLTAPSCALCRKCSVSLGDCCVFQQRSKLLEKLI